MELIKAAERGEIQTVKTLLANGAEVNAKTNLGVTALIIASEKGHNDVVKALLAEGADVNAKNVSWKTALMVASENGHGDIVKALIVKAADVNAKSNDGSTALIVVSWKGHGEIVKALLAKGANVNAKHNDGNTALILASQYGHGEIVKALLDKGADVNAKRSDGVTALSAANYNEEIIQLLKKAYDNGEVVSIEKEEQPNKIQTQKRQKERKINLTEGNNIDHQFNDKGICLNCGCSRTAVESFNFNCKKREESKGSVKEKEMKTQCSKKNKSQGFFERLFGSKKRSLLQDGQKQTKQSDLAEDEVLLMDEELIEATKDDNTDDLTENCPSLRSGSPNEIVEYWEKSSHKACGNCRHFSYAVGERDPLCYMEQTIAIINKLDPSNIKPKEIKPTDYCLSWFKRK